MAEVKVLGVWGSPFSRRVELALKLKGVSFESIEEDLGNKSPMLLKYNPVHKKIPVLAHNEKPIAESLVIVEYIDETWEGHSILPADPYQRAMARFWAKFIDEKIIGTVFKVFREEDEKALEEVQQNLEILDNEVKGKKFFGGESIGFVDIAANFIAFWIGAIEEAVETETKIMDEHKFPNLCKWTEEFLSVEIVQKSLPPRDKMVAYFKARKAALKEASAASKS